MIGHSISMVDVINFGSQSLQILQGTPLWSTRIFLQSFTPIYCDQYPNVAIFLKNGVIKIQEKKLITQLNFPCLVGAQLVAQHGLSPADITICAGSIASLLERNLVLEYLRR